ncbi:S41 family peptidase [Ideonella sp.]|uniref:S41 family peptidase n=1 Tax=Ideonella sp. TaxID=1929293 RepID=UPI0035AE9336
MTVMRRPLLLAALTLTTLTAQARGYDAAAWQRDYAQLKKTLEQQYANLAWFASPEGGVNLPRLDHLTRQALQAARSDDEARRAIQGFVGAFKDGHFSVLPDQAAPTSAAPEVPARPFDATDPTASCAALGFLPTAREAFSLPLESLPNFRLMGDGLSTVYRSGLATMAGGQKIGVLRIQNFYKEAFPAVCPQGHAWLKAKGDRIDEKSLRDAADHRWFEGLAEQIDELKAAGMTTLLIDVGSNSGGNDSGDLFPRLLTDKPVRSSRLRMAASAAATAYADEQLKTLDAALKTSPPAEARDALGRAREFFVQAKAQAQQPCDMAWVWTQQRPWASQGCKRLVDVGHAGGFAATLPRGAFGDQNIAYRLSYPSSADDLWAMWSGPLYVLTDGRTYSSAEMFTAVVQDNHLGKTVGATTGGDGCGFMSGDKPKILTHSRLRLRMPDCMRLRADGSDEVAGIAPDLPVLATEGEDGRQRAVRALETIAADVLAR